MPTFIDPRAAYDNPRECRDCGRYQACNGEGYCPGCVDFQEEERRADEAKERVYCHHCRTDDHGPTASKHDVE